MKRLIIIFAVNLLSRQIMQAQGTVYISDLGQISAGNNPIGSNSWCAADFLTGPNAGGYTLDSIQLQMANATDNPNNLTAMLYSGVDVLAPVLKVTLLRWTELPIRQRLLSILTPRVLIFCCHQAHGTSSCSPLALLLPMVLTTGVTAAVSATFEAEAG